ncbi:YdcF family protein [Streptomyces subrutilus]|uniref:YdcF family protein n=1 Tax=Streptomyces subrutilus TaxID=36818 RepID=UPI0033DB1503
MISVQAWSDAQRLWDFQQMHHEPRPCSAGIVLGGRGPGVVGTAVELYRRRMVPVVVVAGGAAGERVVELGVPAGAVLVAPDAPDADGAIRGARALLDGRGVEVASVLLVTGPYAERGAHAAARAVWPEAEVVVASPPLTLREYVDAVQDVRLVFDILVGAQQRLPLAGREAPRAVAEAYGRLCAEGFTGRVVPA